jgi:hypothetical protein
MASFAEMFEQAGADERLTMLLQFARGYLQGSGIPQFAREQLTAILDRLEAIINKETEE